MGDDRNDHPSNAQTHSFGAGKDVLFGWLVGRAAADLGLAQAIAASEAQRNEQLKRLEESLFAQVQQLNKQQGGADGPTITALGINELKAEIQNFTERMVSLESATEQTHHLSNTLKAEIASVEDQIVGQQSRIESGNSEFEQLEQSISAKVRELEQQIGTVPSAHDRLTSEIGEVRSQLQSLTDRVIGYELLASTALTRTELEAERWRWTADVDDRVMARVRQLGEEIGDHVKVLDMIKINQEAGTIEIARLFQRLVSIEAASHEAAGELKAELGAQREASRSRDLERKANEKHLRERLDEVEQKLGTGESRLREQWDSAAKWHQEEVDKLVARIETLANNVSDSKAANGADQMQWKKDVAESWTARIVSVEESLKDLRFVEKQRADDGDLKLAMQMLTDRTEKVEFTAQQLQAMSVVHMQRAAHAADAVKAEFTHFQTEIIEQLRKLPAPQVLVTALDEKFARKLDEVQNQIEQVRQHSDNRDHHFQQFRSELQTLLQRVGEAEAGTHHIHALMVNESEQNAQLYDGLRQQHDTLRAQLSDGRLNDKAVRDLEENFRRQISVLENQLSQRLSLLERRDADFRELSRADEILDRRNAVTPISTPVAAIAPLPPLTAATIAFNTPRVEQESATGSALGWTQSRRQDATTELLESPLTDDILNSGNRDQLKQLQERISADIERARNELREKSGRWKVRR